MTTTLVALGLVNWVGTLILVESEFTRSLREWVRRKAQAAGPRRTWGWGGRAPTPDGIVRAIANGAITVNEALELETTDPRILRANPPRNPRAYWAWGRAAYLVACHLCAGTWVGLGLALLVPPVAGAGVVGWAVTGLAIKAIGHLTLEVAALLRRVAP